MNIEELVGLGKVKKEIEPFEGLKIVCHTLTASEEQKVNEYISKFPSDTLSRAKPFQIETLVNSIESISGRVFTDEKELREFLSNLQAMVLNELYSAYLNLQRESSESIEKLKKNLVPNTPG